MPSHTHQCFYQLNQLLLVCKTKNMSNIWLYVIRAWKILCHKTIHKEFHMVGYDDVCKSNSISFQSNFRWNCWIWLDSVLIRLILLIISGFLWHFTKNTSLTCEVEINMFLKKDSILKIVYIVATLGNQERITLHHPS